MPAFHSPQDVYARKLLSHRGYPLWTPEPNVGLPECYRMEGLQLGDVGVVVPEDGSFDVFFNITFPVDHRLHEADGVPNNFTQVKLGQGDYRVIPDAECPGRAITSSALHCKVDSTYPFQADGKAHTLSDYHFSPRRDDEGAMLILPQGAESHRMTKTLLLLDLVIQNAVEWYRFAREQLYRDVSNDALYLITGFHKAEAWSLASFKYAPTLSAKCKIMQLGIASSILPDRCSWEATDPLDWRIGPRHSDGRGIPNQTVFIVGFRIAVNEELFHWKRVTVRADHSNRTLASRLVGIGSTVASTLLSLARSKAPCPESTRDEGADESSHEYSPSQNDVSVKNVAQIFKPFHPSDIINHYMLKRSPSSKIAVTHDSQWIDLLERGILEPHDMLQTEHLEAAVSREYNIVTKDGAVYLGKIHGHRLPKAHQKLTRTTLISHVFDSTTRFLGFDNWSSPAVVEKSAPSIDPLPHIADAFRQYIHTDIPVRFIDTDNLKFVERDAVFDIFLPDIAQITEEDVEKRMHTLRMDIDINPESGNYVSSRKMALIDIIRNVVRYAIFSHRWTDSEPMYQDVVTPGRLNYGRKREIKAAGLAKLIRLCETARSQGYKLVWSDTCCIDKTNPTELSEAIHAMFRWYANAHMCIVHLGASSSLTDFDHEPWFARGWTLQELLAPRRIKFYDKDWHSLTTQSNDKDENHYELMLALSNVTGIPQDTIIADNSQGIKGRCVWEIMSWASKRETTRIEDAAYCLFGIFDVHPPIAYGEGDKAFPRLVEEILTKYRTWDVFAWAGQASKQHAVLPSSPACYREWDEENTSGGVEMTDFALTAHGLRLTSMPLIPVAFVSEAKAHDGLYTVMLHPQPRNAATTAQLGDVRVVCGSNRLLQLRGATDLHVCILNYKPDLWKYNKGHLQTGRRYLCFLLYMQRQDAKGKMTWLKFSTENVLHITCRGEPSGNRTGHTPEAGNGEFDLPLETIYIREPRAQSALRI